MNDKRGRGPTNSFHLHASHSLELEIQNQNNYFSFPVKRIPEKASAELTSSDFRSRFNSFSPSISFWRKVPAKSHKFMATIHSATVRQLHSPTLYRIELNSNYHNPTQNQSTLALVLVWISSSSMLRSGTGTGSEETEPGL